MTPRRFRLDSATAGEVTEQSVEWTSTRGWSLFPSRRNRGIRLLLHWWALGHDPARALRCPRCHGSGMALLVQERSPYRYAGDPRCAFCHGRGWSLPSERGER